MRKQGVIAVLWSLALILVYVAFRFQLAFAPGAVLALVHDVLVTIGVMTLAGVELGLTSVGALLTIVGYSLNDTLVIYDRVRENLVLHPTEPLPDLIDRSLNDTLSRTLLTSGTTLISILCLLVLGGPVLREFAVALLVGVVAGTWSTVYVASPMVLWTQKRLPLERPEDTTRPEGAAAPDVLVDRRRRPPPRGPGTPAPRRPGAPAR
jgi:preprotein translocase subunit SecF